MNITLGSLQQRAERGLALSRPMKPDLDNANVGTCDS